MDIVLAQPRGFCAGVFRAVDIMDQALEQFGSPIYVFHEIVHNPHVVKDLMQKGAVTIFSAHGVATSVVTSPADVDSLTVIDPEKLAYVTQTTLSVDDKPKKADAEPVHLAAICTTDD